MALELTVPTEFLESPAAPARCFVSGAPDAPVERRPLTVFTYFRRQWHPEIAWTQAMPVSAQGWARWERIQPRPFRSMLLSLCVSLPLLIGAVLVADIPELMGSMIAAAVAFGIGQMFFLSYRLGTVGQVWWVDENTRRLRFPRGQAEAHAAWQAALQAWQQRNG